MPGFELFGEKEKSEVLDVLESGILMRYGFDNLRNGHFKAKDLESEITKRFNVSHSQLASSGTAAISMALAVAGIGAGDEVIIPSFTFVASFEAVLLIGAIPIVVDIDDTLTLDIESVKKSITSKTKAIMPVHMCGSMADMGSLIEISNKHSLILIEDACQAIGGTYNGIPLGTIGDLGCFSFDFVKTVTCGEGGVVVTNNKEFALKLDYFSDHGHDHVGNNRGAESHPYIGYNFRISELNSAVGLAQFRRLDEFLEIQKNNYTILRNALQEIDSITFRTVPKGGVESYAFLNFYLNDIQSAKAVARSFSSSGIDSCFYYLDNNWHYINNWDHFKEIKSLYPFPNELAQGLKYLKTKDFSKSDYYIGRNISCLIKLSWTKEEVTERAKIMVDCINAVIKN